MVWSLFSLDTHWRGLFLAIAENEGRSVGRCSAAGFSQKVLKLKERLQMESDFRQLTLCCDI